MAEDFEWLEYAVYYPDVGDEDYDPEHPGEHPGDVRGVRDDAPQWAKEAYERYCIREANGLRA